MASAMKPTSAPNVRISAGSISVDRRPHRPPHFAVVAVRNAQAQFVEPPALLTHRHHLAQPVAAVCR